MPILKNAKKALRVAKRKTVINSKIRSVMKTMVDKVRKAPSMEALASAYSAIDTAVKNKLVHKNKAARLKSQLNNLVRLVSGSVEEVATATAKVAQKVKKAATKTAVKAKKTAAATTKKAPAKKTAAKKAK